VKFVRLRRPKIAHSPSYMDYRSKTSAAVVLDTSHPTWGPSMGGIGQGKETKNLNMTDFFHCAGTNIVILKLAKATMGRGLGSSEEDWQR
jgi:hypothetical protein